MTQIIKNQSKDQNFIRGDCVAAVFIPGFIQLKNGQVEKTIIFNLWIFGIILFWLLDLDNIVLMVVPGMVYLYSILDSLSIYRELNQKRRSVTSDALKYFNNPSKRTQNRNYIDLGERFEKFVLNKFDTTDFSIVQMTSPFQKANSHYIEKNLDPDFIFRYKPSLEKFCIEAKYRSNYGPNNLIKWASFTDQMLRYQQFEKEEKIPVYIVIGLGGTPENPDKMFLIPLKRIKSIELSAELLTKYEVNPQRKFTWRPGSFWNSGYLFQLPDTEESPIP